MRQLARLALSASERIANYQGTVASFIAVAMVLMVAYGVVMRYMFRQGIAWTFEVPVFAFLSINALGLAYVQLKRRHLRVDLLVMNLPRRRKNILGAFSCIVFLAYAAILVLALAIRIPDDLVMRSEVVRLPIAVLDIILCIGLVTLILQLLVDLGKELVDFSHKPPSG